MFRRPLSELSYIIVHHSATPDHWNVEDLRHIHLLLGYADVGYHFVVNHKGLHVGRPILYVGAHALPDKKPYLGRNMNRISIGLCLVGDFSDHPPDPKLINEAAYALRRVAEKYNIPLDRQHIIGHRDVSFTICPGPHTMRKIYEKLGI